MKKIAIFALVTIAGLAVFFLFPRSSKSPATTPETDPVAAEEQEKDHASHAGAPQPVYNPAISIVGRKPYKTGITNDQRVQQDKKGRNVVMEAVKIANGLHSEDSAPEEDLEYIDQSLSFYRLSFQRNPVAADNRMVMKALLGENPGNLVVFPFDHPSLDSTGQLLDRWGTPYFFHPLSGTKMEIFSAGPDKTLNTPDDIAWAERDGKPLTGREEIEDDQLDAKP